ncbi:hypothetical protein WG902_05935 [Ramlibacter sp. PS3R-8]|uniref:hypothetical protein n=1 Tax=Ramlibacter sp. PS3R-8 TaxID=3133437 RepID=UPI0030A5F5B3
MRTVFALAAAALVLAACAHPWNTVDVAPGTPRDEVIARAGQPVRVVPMPEGGQRLQYTMQPWGRYAFMVDLDASGRVVRSRQVLTAQEFARIEEGKWTGADVLREFGPPAQVDGVASWNGPIMMYRWKELGGSPMLYYVYLDPQGTVGRAHQAMELVNAPNERK